MCLVFCDHSYVHARIRKLGWKSQVRSGRVGSEKDMGGYSGMLAFYICILGLSNVRITHIVKQIS